MKLYSVRDRKSNQFSVPFGGLADGEACRNLMEMAREGSLLRKYPGDYSLFCVGSIDPNTGFLTPIDPVFVSELATMLEVSNG